MKFEVEFPTITVDAPDILTAAWKAWAGTDTRSLTVKVRQPGSDAHVVVELKEENAAEQLARLAEMGGGDAAGH